MIEFSHTVVPQQPDFGNVGHGLGQYLVSEFASPEAGRDMLAREIGQMAYRRRMGLIYAVGDTYHKHVYFPLASKASKFSDRTERALSDIYLGLYRHVDKMIAVGAAALVVSLKKVFEGSYTVSTSEVAFVSAAMAVASIALGLTRLNLLRTPLSEKLGINRREFDFDSSLAFVVERVNDLFIPEDEIDFEDYDKIRTAVETFVEKVDGYCSRLPARVKSSRFSDDLLFRGSKSIHFDPLFGEIVFTRGKTMRVLTELAHEYAHSSGILQEYFAELAGVLAQIRSDDKTVQYLGYRAWLHLLIRHYRQDEGVDMKVALDHFRDSGLKDEVAGELQEEYDALQKREEKYLHQMWEMRLIRGLGRIIPNRLKKCLIRLGGGVCGMIGLDAGSLEVNDVTYMLSEKITRRGKSHRVYVEIPLAYLQNYVE